VTRRTPILLAGLIVLLSAVSASAQIAAPTFIVGPTTGRFTLNPAADYDQTFGTPPVPIVSSLVIDFFLKASVTDFVNCITVPVAPVFTSDFGKPAAVANVVTSPAILTLFPTMLPNTEYYACARALGPNGSSPRSAAASTLTGNPIPFGFPSAPGKATGTTIAP